MRNVISRRLAQTSGTQTSGKVKTAESGTSVIGTIIVISLVFLIAELIVVGGQIAGAQAAVANAARESARRGSLVQSDAQTWPAIEAYARTNMQQNGQDCEPLYVQQTGTNFQAGKWIVVRVTCTVKLSEFSGLGLPLPDMAVTASHKEPLETYRAFGELSP